MWESDLVALKWTLWLFCLVPFTLSLKPTGIPEDLPVQTPAFTNAVRLYRQAKGHYGTWDMMCGQPPQVRFLEFFNITHLYEYNR